MSIEENMNLLCCPKCKSSIYMDKSKMICSKCETQYSIENGIPVLINPENLNDHLKKQISYFEHEKITSDHEYILYPWQKSYTNRFIENFPLIKDKIIIDCATGSGYLALELAKKGANVIATDLTLKSLVRLKKVAEKLGISEKILLVCCTAEELPFKDNVADYFIANAILEHLPKETEAIHDIYRVTKVKSGVMVTVPLCYKYIYPLFIPLNFIHDKKIGHLRRYDENSLKSKFRQFDTEKVYYTGHERKVFKTLINIVSPRYDENEIEDEDRKYDNNPVFASNICIIFKKV